MIEILFFYTSHLFHCLLQKRDGFHLISIFWLKAFDIILCGARTSMAKNTRIGIHAIVHFSYQTSPNFEFGTFFCWIGLVLSKIGQVLHVNPIFVDNGLESSIVCGQSIELLDQFMLFIWTQTIQQCKASETQKFRKS